MGGENTEYGADQIQILEGLEGILADVESGKLKIKVDYTNNTKTTVDINGKKETMYTPFVLMTGMILPQDTFSNVKIDNGKVISDGSRNIVIGFGMPGLQESLGLNSDSLEDLVSGDSDFELPESLEITADVENFSLDSTFTVALDDVLDTIDTDNITGYDDLKDALSDLEDAAMELVDGSKALSDGVDTLKDSYKELDDGIGTDADEISHTGNIVVDSLVNHKYALAQKDGIQFEARVFIPSVLPFQSGHLAIIFGNLLENALEACRKLPQEQRYIILEATYIKEMLQICIKNSSPEKLKKDNSGRYLTTKEDNGWHGIGLASVEQALADYNGELFTKYEHGEFRASAVLYSNSIEEK